MPCLADRVVWYEEERAGEEAMSFARRDCVRDGGCMLVFGRRSRDGPDMALLMVMCYLRG